MASIIPESNPRWRSSLQGLAVAVLAVSEASAATPTALSATTPFGEAKLTDANGVVSYRVGGVFAASANDQTRLSFTIICSPDVGSLALLIVRTNAPPALTSGAAVISASVDGHAPLQLSAVRMTDGGLAGYTISPSQGVEGLAGQMAGGTKLHLDLDDFSPEIPLAGFADKLAVMTSVCPHR